MKRSWSTLSLVLAFLFGLLLVPIVIAVLGLFGRLPSDSVSAPPGWEASLGERALDEALEHRTAGLHNPVAANDAAALAGGMQLYGDNCAGCHGGVAGPSRWGSQNFYPRVPQFWQEHEHGHLTPEEAYTAVHDGIRYSGMGAWRGMLSEQEIWQVANFVSRMHSLPRAIDRQWRAEAQETPAD
jgi:mono/diheme cytochrome c family protein